MDGLAHQAAQIMGPLGETLVQTPPAVALLGHQTRYTGHAYSATYRWFTDSVARALPPRQARQEQPYQRRAVVGAPRGCLRQSDTKRFVHPRSARWTSTANSSWTPARAVTAHLPPPPARRATRSSRCSACWAPISSPPLRGDTLLSSTSYKCGGGTPCWRCASRR
ncbi:hypothetical protein [Streptomyces antibioticus]|uniref:hypothetical protein n=1 Tax=Streptomyces antibioticus TaxID=1890 RepID=UPI00379DBD76